MAIFSLLGGIDFVGSVAPGSVFITFRYWFSWFRGTWQCFHCFLVLISLVSWYLAMFSLLLGIDFVGFVVPGSVFIAFRY